MLAQKKQFKNGRDHIGQIFSFFSILCQYAENVQLI